MNRDANTLRVREVARLVAAVVETRAEARHDGRRTAGHAFENRNAEAFGPIREDRDIARAIQRGQLALGKEAVDVDDLRRAGVRLEIVEGAPDGIVPVEEVLRVVLEHEDDVIGRGERLPPRS